MGIVTALGLIIAGLSLPVMSIRKLVFWKDDYSIVQGVMSLWDNSHYALAAIIFAFSVVFPNVKLAILGGIWVAPLTEDARRRTLWWMKALGKWSMLDVFVVAVTIVLSSSKGALDARPQIGLYFFTAGVLLSLVVTLWIEHIAKHTDTGGD